MLSIPSGPGWLAHQNTEKCTKSKAGVGQPFPIQDLGAASADTVHFSGKTGKTDGAAPIPPFHGLRRLGILVTPEKLKTGEIKLENPDNVPFDLDHLVSTTNPGVYHDIDEKTGKDNGTYIFVRAIIGKGYGKEPAKSYQLMGHMADGKTLKSLRIVPELSPSDKPVPGSTPAVLNYGLEDVRVTKHEDGNFYLVGNGYDGVHCYMVAFKTDDLKSGRFEPVGVIGPNHFDPDTLRPSVTGPRKKPGKSLMDKDGVLHAEKVNGKYLVYHRLVPNMQAYSADRLEDFMDDAYWQEALKPENIQQNTVLKREDDSWQARLGWGGPPIKTDQGWLHIIHASNNKDDNTIVPNEDGTPGKKKYCAGAILTDLKDPSKVIARVPIPIMQPETDAERFGPVGNVIFPQGHRLVGDELTIYYGAADDKIGVAKTSLKELLAYVSRFDADGKLR